MQIPIKRTVERMPGGMMVVPLLTGCIITTFAPDLLKFFGSFTAALFSGALPILAVFYVCMGSTIDLKMTGYIAKKGGSLFATKILLGVMVGLIAGHFLGERPIDQGFFAGLSALALVAAINDTNGGLYMALVSRYGRDGRRGRILDYVDRKRAVSHHGESGCSWPFRISVANAGRECATE